MSKQLLKDDEFVALMRELCACSKNKNEGLAEAISQMMYGIGKMMTEIEVNENSISNYFSELLGLCNFEGYSTQIVSQFIARMIYITIMYIPREVSKYDFNNVKPYSNNYIEFFKEICSAIKKEFDKHK